MDRLSNKEKIVRLLKSLETQDRSVLAYINPDKYIQHNLRGTDGIAGFEAVLARMPAGTTVNTVRVMEDGDLVFAHSDYFFTSRRIGFDIFRFEGGLIVEHWDNLQAFEGPGPNGHTMIDGPVVVEDLDKTEFNKSLVSRHMDDVLNGRLDKLPAYYEGDNYIQHNAWIGDGLSGLVRGIGEWAKQGIRLKYDKIHRVMGEGNFVLVVSECHFKGVHSAFYDMYRVASGKIAEHWDIIEEIPAESEWKNGNGKF